MSLENKELYSITVNTVKHNLYFLDAAPSSRNIDVPLYSSNLPAIIPNLHPDPFTMPNYEYSSSVPSSNFVPPQFPTQYEERDDLDGRPIKVMDGLNHQRSNSTGYQPEKTFQIGDSRSPASKKRAYADPYGKEILSSKLNSNQPSEGNGDCERGEFQPKGLRKSSRNSSRSSLHSLDSDSSAGVRSDGERHGGRKASSGSSEKLQQQGYSSGEYRKRSSHHRRNKSRESQQQNPSRDGGKSFGSKIMHRVLSDVGLNSSPTRESAAAARGNASDKERQTRRRASGGSSGRVSSDQSGDTKSPGTNRSYHSSSDGAGRKKTHSPAIFYKDDDPSYIHNSINLYLDMEVFDISKGEHFRMAFRSHVVKYGEVGEIPVLVIVSNLHAYVFKIIAPER